MPCTEKNEREHPGNSRAPDRLVLPAQAPFRSACEGTWDGAERVDMQESHDCYGDHRDDLEITVDMLLKRRHVSPRVGISDVPQRGRRMHRYGYDHEQEDEAH